MKHIVSSLFVTACLLIISCSDQHSSSVPGSVEETATLKLTVNMGKTGKLAKAMRSTTIEMANLIINLSAEGKGSTIDTITLTGGSEKQTERVTYGNLASLADGEKIEWTLSVKAEDKTGRVIHMGDTVFTLNPDDTTEVSLSLQAKYSMLVANFYPIRDSVTRCEINIDTGDVEADSSFEKQSLLGDTVTLSYDYLTASPSGIEHHIELNVYGESLGNDTLLYTGDTILLVKSGEDKTYKVYLRYVGPNTFSGAAVIVVDIGETGTVTIDGVMDADTQQWTPPSGMVKIVAKGKSFSMGSSEYRENPVHQVTFTEDFWIDTTEVTQKQYQILMKETYNAYTNPGWKSSEGLGDNYPVYYVNWYDAILYCNARAKAAGSNDTVYRYTSINGIPGNGCSLSELEIDLSVSGFRLPTEAEWEFACRGGTTTDFYWGKNYDPYPSTAADSIEVGSFVVWTKNNNYTVNPVATKIKNNFGLYDMSGNVCEWCNDWYGSYTTDTLIDPSGPESGSQKVIRGGHWSSIAYTLRSNNRIPMYPDELDIITGFRTCLSFQ